MDTNGTVGNRSNQVPSNQVKGIDDRKKEPYNSSIHSTTYRSFAGARTHAEHKQQWPKSYTLSNRNGRRGDYAQKLVKGVTQEFRVVRDNRRNCNATTDNVPGSLGNSSEENHQLTQNVLEKRLPCPRCLPCSSSGKQADHKHSPARHSDGNTEGESENGLFDSGPGHSNNESSRGSAQPSLPKENQMTVSHLVRTVSREVKNSEPFASATSVDGVYSSPLDPIHVPSSRSVGAVGAIRRAVGAVGVQRQSTDQSSTSNTNSNHSYPIPLLEGDASFSRQAATTLKNNPESSNSSISVGRSFPASQYHAKLQQVIGHNKASQANKEWKPKLNQKPNVDGPGTGTQPSQLNRPALSEKPVQDTTSKNEHVIIPQHLQVPESERSGIMFGSFGAGLDCLKASKSSEEDSDIHISSVSASFAVGFDKDVDGDQSVSVDPLVITSRSNHPISPSEPKHALPINEGTLSPRDIESYPDIELIQSHNPSCSSVEPQPHQNPPSLPEFSAYDPQMRLVAPITKMMVEKDNTRGRGFSSAHEGLNSHVANNKSLSSVSMAQQQQPVAQLYSQVPISHYPSFVPYRQVFSPLYVPQMVMPNYSNGTVHSHLSAGNNYLLMPGGAPQLNGTSMKYATSQYKPVQSGSPTAAYGSYTNQVGYTVGLTGSSTGLEDMASINYKDDNVYNPQLESDIWIQPREVATMQSTPYYNISGQGAVPPTPHPAYLPGAHTTNPSIYPAAFQPSHVQYPGIYHPSQPGSFVAPANHTIQQQQQVPSGLAGNTAIGLGTYQQQPQVGTHGWGGY